TRKSFLQFLAQCGIADHGRAGAELAGVAHQARDILVRGQRFYGERVLAVARAGETDDVERCSADRTWAAEDCDSAVEHVAQIELGNPLRILIHHAPPSQGLKPAK